MFDLTAVDVPQNMVDPEVHAQLAKMEKISALQTIFKDQYQKLDNLGEDLILEFSNELSDDEVRFSIFSEMIKFINENWLTIGDIDNLSEDPDRINIAGEYIYSFICVDNINAILPAFVEIIGCSDISEFDNYINLQYSDNYSKFRADYISIIQTTINQLLKLQSLDENVKRDKKYQKILAKYYYYQELVDYCDVETFLTNYIRPVINKYFSTLLWRLI
jgi:hypothetical protein